MADSARSFFISIFKNISMHNARFFDEKKAFVFEWSSKGLEVVGGRASPMHGRKS